jgi:ribonucleoside-diphosphate reductase alpha chain
MWNKGKMITSCADAVARSLETFINVKEKGMINGTIHISDISKMSSNKESSNLLCPDCGSGIEHSEGCMKCISNCGWSKC